MNRLLWIRLPGVLAGLLCSANGCSGGGRGAVGSSPLPTPVLTPGCGTVIVGVGSRQSRSYSSPPDPGYGGGTPVPYRVERSTDGGSTWTTVATVPANPSASVTLQDQPSQPLQFRFSTDGSGPSPAATTTPLAAPDAPTGVAALPGSSRATVTWRLPQSDHGSPFTLTILADQTGASNRYQFPATATATRAVVGDQIHPLLSDVDPGTWSFRISASNQCGTATSDPTPAIQMLPWNPTPTDRPFPLGTTLTAMGSVQFAGTQYLIGGLDDDFRERTVTLSTRFDPISADGRLLPWRQVGDLNIGRASLAVALHQSADRSVHLYAMGGRSLGFQLSPAVEAGVVQPDGSVSWSNAPEIAGAPLPQALASAAGFVHGQFLYALGGFTRDPGSDVDGLTDKVMVTRINADGSLPQDSVVDGQTVSAWRVAGSTPPGVNSSHRAGAAAVVVGDFLFVLGGFGFDETLRGPFLIELSSVYRIRLRDDGMLDCPSDCNWERMPDLTDASGNPFPVGGGSAFFLHGRLYYMGGFSGVKSGVVLLSQLDGIASGDVVSGPWTELASFSPPLIVNNGEFDRIGAAGFGFGSFLYVAGGTRSTPEAHVLGDSLFAHLSGDGTIGP